MYGVFAKDRPLLALLLSFIAAVVVLGTTPASTSPLLSKPCCRALVRRSTAADRCAYDAWCQFGERRSM